MFAKLFVCTLLGALYASGWWAWAFLPIIEPFLIIPLIVIAVGFLFLLIAVAFLKEHN